MKNTEKDTGISYKDSELFSKIVENFCKPKSINEGSDKKCIEKQLQKYLNTYINKKESQLEQVKEYYKNISGMEVKEYEVITGIKGISMSSIKKVELGKFSIYDIYTVDRYIDKESNSHWIESIQEDILEADENNRIGIKENRYLVSVKVVAKNSTFAVEIAKRSFSYLENILKIFISPFSKNLDVGIYNFKNFNIQSHYILIDGINVSLNNDWNGASTPIDLKELLKIVNNNNLSYIWELFFKQEKTDMDHRIIRAINWTGKGLRDSDKGRSLVQYTIALEALLQKKKKGELVGPSITQGIADGVAFILFNTLEERLNIISKVSNIYNERSNVVHGTNEDVNERNVYEAFTIVRNLIFELLKNSGNKFMTIDEVLYFVKEMKYGKKLKDKD